MNHSKTKSVVMMLCSALFFSMMQVFVKITSTEVGTFEQTFFRNLISLLIALSMVKKGGVPVWAEIKKGFWPLFWRSFFGFLGVLLFFYATAHAKQTDVAMLNRSSPVFVTLFAGIFLKERISKVKIASTVLCLTGAYIAMQPTFDSNPFPLIAAFSAAIVAGIAYTFVSYCKRFASPMTIILHFSLFSTFFAGVLMVQDFVVPSLLTGCMLVLIGIFAAGGQILLTYAYRLAPASEVSIYQYSGVVFTAILSFFLFGESLSPASAFGGGLILCAIYWVFAYHKSD